MATNNSKEHSTPDMYKPEYWDAMKSQLDKEMPVRIVQKPFFKRSVLALGIGIGLSMGWFIWSYDEPVADSVAENVSVSQDEPAPTTNSDREGDVQDITLEAPGGAASVDDVPGVEQPMNEFNRGQSNEDAPETAMIQAEQDDAPEEKNVSANFQSTEQDELTRVDSKQVTNEKAMSAPGSERSWNLASTDLAAMQKRSLADARNSIEKSVSITRVGGHGNHLNRFAARDVQVLAFGGANISKGFSNTATPGSASLDVMFGLGIQKQLGFNTSVRFTANYVARSGHELVQTKEIITYFLDRYVTLENIRTEKLQFLHLPLELRYRLGSRHYVSSGIFVSYLLNAHGERKIYYEDSQSEVELETSEARGYIGGFAPLSYGMSLGYEYAITPFINSGMRYNIGLNDVSLDTEFKGSAFDRISDLQLWIGIRLSR